MSPHGGASAAIIAISVLILAGYMASDRLFLLFCLGGLFFFLTIWILYLVLTAIMRRDP